MLNNRNVINFLFHIQEIAWVQFSFLMACIIFLLISIRILYLSIKSGKIPPSIDQRTDFGDVQISMETIKNLSLKAAAQIKGTTDLKSRVQVSDAGLEISMRTIVDGESPIPDLTEEVQRMVKEHIEDITGIPVASVSVYVANIVAIQNVKSRVE